MRACKLNESEARRLEQEGVVPSCDNHAHVSFNEASEKVEEELWRWVASSSDLASKRRVTVATQISHYSKRPSVIRDNRGRMLGYVEVMQACTRG